MTVILVILVLAVAGLGGALLLVVRRPPIDQAALLEQLVTTNQAQLKTQHDLAATELEGKRSLIDQQLSVMTDRLDRVGSLVQELETDRERKFGQLSTQLSQQHEGLESLLETTQSLREVLSSTKARGRWGERMAEDVLRLSGLIENVNYRKQRGIEGGVPDFTFLLPNDLLLHMDVKFPLDNYVRCIEAESELDERRFRDDFLRDVRGHVKTLASRTYIDPEGGTVDFVLLFIPNDSLYTFIHEHDDSILDEAAGRHVVFCSPLTLFAVLALIRQTIDNVALARTSDEILALLGAFKKQWGAFVEKMDKLDRSLTTARKDYDELAGTRRRALERPLDRIDALRNEQQLDLIEADLLSNDSEDPLALEA
jgi:DNA recombination protein RmuC